jgi:hypothetical protein
MVAIALAQSAPAAITSFPIVDNGHFNTFPRIDGNVVVWTNATYLGSTQPSDDVEGKNLNTGEMISIAATSINESGGAISDGIVVWGESTVPASTLRGRNLNTGQSITIVDAPNNQIVPAISNNTAIWQERVNNQRRVRGRFLADPVSPTFDISGPLDNLTPAEVGIAGSIVVWTDRITPGIYNERAYWRDLNTPAIRRVSDVESAQLHVRTSERFIVWMDDRDNKQQIYARDLLTGAEFPVAPFSDTSGATFQTSPAIDGSIVVWQLVQSNLEGIYARDLSSMAPAFPIAPLSSIGKSRPDISGSTVVWEHGNGMRPGIYGAVIPEPTMGLVVVIGIGLRRRR